MDTPCKARSPHTEGVRYAINAHWLNGIPIFALASAIAGGTYARGIVLGVTKFAPDVKSMPHWHPDVARTVVVLSGALYFAVGKQWDEKQTQGVSGSYFHRGSTDNTRQRTVRLSSGHRHWPDRDDDDPTKSNDASARRSGDQLMHDAASAQVLNWHEAPLRQSTLGMAGIGGTTDQDSRAKKPGLNGRG
jgi:hypothetical protein